MFKKIFFIICCCGFFEIPLYSSNSEDLFIKNIDKEGYKIKISKEEKKRKAFTIKKYEDLTSLECTWNEKITELTQICFYVKNKNQKIGEILLQYYPFGATEMYKTAKNPTLRVRDITIEEHFRHQGHGGRALETLFTILRRNNLPSTTEVYLETNTNPSYLMNMWVKFGFSTIENTFWNDVKILSAPLKKVKFPYYNKK